MHYLVVQARKENNYHLLKLFLENFDGLLENNKWLKDDGWYTWYGELCLENKDPDTAISIYKVGVKKFPNSSKINSAFGDAFRMKNNNKLASEYYEKAIKIAKKTSESDLEKYEAKLKEIRNK